MEPLPDIPKDRVVYSVHLYSFWPWTHWPSEKDFDLNWRLKHLWFGVKYNVPMMVTEFGTNKDDAYWKNVINSLQKHGNIHFAYWSIDGYNLKKDPYEDESYGILNQEWDTVRHKWKLDDLRSIQEFHKDSSMLCLMKDSWEPHGWKESKERACEKWFRDEVDYDYTSCAKNTGGMLEHCAATCCRRCNVRRKNCLQPSIKDNWSPPHFNNKENACQEWWNDSKWGARQNCDECHKNIKGMLGHCSFTCCSRCNVLKRNCENVVDTWKPKHFKNEGNACQEWWNESNLIVMNVYMNGARQNCDECLHEINEFGPTYCAKTCCKECNSVKEEMGNMSKKAHRN